jgi:hypothetical protein
MPTVPLNESGFVTLDGSGNGTVRIGPDEPAARWSPTVASVSVTTNVLEASAQIYAGPAPTQQYFVDATFTASSGDSTDRITGKVIARTQLPYLFAVFSGGDPGSQATLSVTGTKAIP